MTGDALFVCSDIDDVERIGDLAEGRFLPAANPFWILDVFSDSERDSLFKSRQPWTVGQSFPFNDIFQSDNQSSGTILFGPSRQERRHPWGLLWRLVNGFEDLDDTNAGLAVRELPESFKSFFRINPRGILAALSNCRHRKGSLPQKEFRSSVQGLHYSGR